MMNLIACSSSLPPDFSFVGERAEEELEEPSTIGSNFLWTVRRLGFALLVRLELE
jgi:hypothetical protein